MAENSAIEWCDHTFNPWEGCQKVGPGCDHCYAETRNARYGGGVAVNWGAGAPRRRTSVGNWRKPLRWQTDAARFLAEHGRRQRVFCASLADVFDNAVDPAWRADLFEMIRSTPNLDWLLLTKRIRNVATMVEAVGGMPANVWLGATIVNQVEADRDIPKLLAVSASIRFLSMEPLLGPIDLESITVDGDHELNALKADRWEDEVENWRGSSDTWEADFEDWFSRPATVTGPMHPGLDWIIVGGESGPGARPMHPDWARSLRDQCEAAGVAFLFKQWGEIGPAGDVGIDHLAEDRDTMLRVGKKAAGRLLDGRTHDASPCASSLARSVGQGG